MKFFATESLVTQSMKEARPWEFQANVSAEVCADKNLRQDFYRNPEIRHLFYTSLEGANPNIRVSKDNPPRAIAGAVADFDLPLTDERVNEVVSLMKIRPSWVERSLGGNLRLVWIFPRSLPVETSDFCVFLLGEMAKWLTLDMLPGLDKAAFHDPARLYCCGHAWRATGHGPVSEDALQSFFVGCGRKYRAKDSAGDSTPLDVIEKAIKERFPSFTWPSDFTADSQGPSFWIPESTTPLSAIVKPDGMFSFSAHATKPFYSWAEILGAEFIKEFGARALAEATKEIWWDGKRFWRKIAGVYNSLDSPELQNHFKVACRLSSKPGREGHSAIDLALDHIYNTSRIAGAAPHMFRPPGVIEFQGQKVLNTYIPRVMHPASELTEWGESGKFPFLSRHFESLFDPPEQRWHFLAWWKAFYESGLNLKPMPGQNVFLMGGVGVGKTMTSRAIISRSVGGFCDASAYLIAASGFNSELLTVPLWCVDDETMGESSASQTNFNAMLKKTAANQHFQHSKKFEVGVTTEWMGRIFVTANLDYISSRALGPLDSGNADKTSIFRCAGQGKIQFPNRHSLVATIENELPHLLRWLTEFDPQTRGVLADVRFGYAAYHEPSLIEQAQQGSKAAPFKELLYEAMLEYFRDNPKHPQWRGNVTHLVRLLHSNPLNDSVIKSLRLEQINRYLDIVQRENCVKLTVEPGPLNTRVWVFHRFSAEPTPAPTLEPPAPGVLNIFSK